MSSTFDEVRQLLETGVSSSLSRVGLNQASRARRTNAGGANNPHANVAARTVSRREATTKGAARSSYLQGIEDAAEADDNNNANSSSNATAKNAIRGGATIREDDGHRREMCSSPRLHPGIQLERLRDYEAERTGKLSRLVHDDCEFAKIALRDEGTTLPGTDPLSQAWTARAVRDVAADDPRLAHAVSARSVPEKRMTRSDLREMERKPPGTYFSGRRPAKPENPGVGHYRPKFELIEARTTGGFISEEPIVITPRSRPQLGGIPALPQFAAPTAHHQLGADGHAAQDGGAGAANRISPEGGQSGAPNRSPSAQNVAAANNKDVRDPHSHGLVAARPPFGVGSGFHPDGDAKKKGADGAAAAAASSQNNAKSANADPNRGTVDPFISSGPATGDYWPRIDPKAPRSRCYVDMGRDSQHVDRNPPAIPIVDIAYPAADGIAMALKSRTPRAFIAPKKPTDPPAHASTVVGHYAEAALVANAVLVAAAGGGGVSAPGDRLDLNPSHSRDYLQKHSASMVDWARSSKTHHGLGGGTRGLHGEETSNAALYGGFDGASAKRTVKPVNMDKMLGRPPLPEAPDVRVTELRDELIHQRPRETTFAPLQPQSVANRMQALRAQREGAPRLCGASDVSPVRPRVGTVGAVEFGKMTARKEPTSGSLDLTYDNLDPAVVSWHRKIGGDPMIATRVSRSMREQLARPRWGALDKIYDVDAGLKATLPTHNATTVYDFGKRVDRQHAFVGTMPSEEFLRRTGAGLPGPGAYVPDDRAASTARGSSPGRSFTRALK